MNEPVHLAHKLCQGGEFLIEPVGSYEIFTPERFSDEQKMYFRTANDFSLKEVVPRIAEIEGKNLTLLRDLMVKAGEIGLLSVDIPEEYGGLGADKATSMLMTQTLTRVGSFAVSIGAHTGIGTLPIVYFGTKEQKQCFLPRLATGEWIAAYALTEPSSGSDALSAKTTAVLSKDGKHYILNGTKQFITNAGFADVFIVFAQVDGNKFTAFIVKRELDGLSTGPEEHKLGIRGSSTCQVILTDVKVPVENVLGEIGRGHKIAFNILNVGRWKLGVGSAGAARECLAHAAAHAAQREQFGRPIGEFGLVARKLAQMATLVYVAESMAYRTAGLIDRRVHDLPDDAPDHDAEMVRVIEEYTVEASILKVFGSEAFDYASDEALQILGGYGYIEEYPIERFFRDSRINRIFEGTNEINRLIVTATLLKRAMRGQLALFEAVGRITKQLEANKTMPPPRSDGPLATECQTVEACKSAVLYTMSFVGRKLGESLKDQQQVLGNLADATIDVFAMDSATARGLQFETEQGAAASAIPVAMTRLFCSTAHTRVFDACREILMWIAEGEEFSTEMKMLARLEKRTPLNALALRDQVAKAVLQHGGYTLRQ